MPRVAGDPRQPGRAHPAREGVDGAPDEPRPCRPEPSARRIASRTAV